MRWIEREMGIWWNIKQVFHNLFWPFKKIILNIIKLIEYFPVVWRDQDWDYAYFLTLIQYKIKRMRVYTHKYSHSTKQKEIESQMKHVELLIEKYLDHSFCEDLHEAHEEKWGKITDMFHPVDVNGQKYYTLDMCREKTTTPELKEQERKEQHEIYRRSEAEEQATLDEIFSFMREHLQTWWD